MLQYTVDDLLCPWDLCPIITWNREQTVCPEASSPRDITAARLCWRPTCLSGSFWKGPGQKMLAESTFFWRVITVNIYTTNFLGIFYFLLEQKSFYKSISFNIWRIILLSIAMMGSLQNLGIRYFLMLCLY